MLPRLTSPKLCVENNCDNLYVAVDQRSFQHFKILTGIFTSFHWGTIWSSYIGCFKSLKSTYTSQRKAYYYSCSRMSPGQPIHFLFFLNIDDFAWFVSMIKIEHRHFYSWCVTAIPLPIALLKFFQPPKLLLGPSHNSFM